MNNFNKQKELARLQREADWKAVLASPEGQRVMGYLLQACGYHASSYGGMDTQATAYREGQRSIGQFIVRQGQIAAPEQVTTIVMGGLQNDFGRDGHNSDNRNNNGEW